ncbi:MAG: hypothetical protein RLY31_1122 [Bacteroidota bacterium]|jgi:DNA helicase-2/ATP-dependent DNA helicase PcrA
MTNTYLDELNDIQRKAVTETEGPVLVVAGPGSGKTRVLTYRIAHLIEKGVPPREIMALTFTNKSAREMQARIGKVVGSQAQRVWAGTFHSLFSRILRIEAERIGYPAHFTIYDTDDTKNLVGNLIKELNLNKEQYNANAVRNRISSCKSNLITPKVYQSRPDLLEEDRLAQRPHFVKLYELYVARCKKSGAMDFDDLLFRLYELLQNHPDVAEKYRRKFRYLLVDEFQDTNTLQYAIVRKLVNYDGSPRNICVVGDDAQSIYAFRGATIQNILDFERDFKPHGIRTFKLEENYRSTSHIVQAANEVISCNRKQIQKTIFSNKGEGQRIRVLRAITDSEEGRRVTDLVLEHKNRFHITNREIAILYRTNAQSRIFEENLRRYNIPYRIVGGQSFYQRKEIKDLIAYLRLSLNQLDEEALRRIINYPRRAIGDTTVSKLSEVAATQGTTLWEALQLPVFTGRTQASLQAFVSLVRDCAAKAQQDNAYVAASYIVRQSGLLDELKADTSLEGIGRLDNITSLLDGISAFVDEDTILPGTAETDEDQRFDKSLVAWLQQAALMTDQDEQDGQDDKVTLMSVHAAKGLEFKSVFVVGLEEDLFPSFMSRESPEGMDEERRLFYVAITRAEQLLTLSFANSRYRYGQERQNQPSRFLDEIQSEHLDASFPLGRQRGGMASPVPDAPAAASRVTGNFRPSGRTAALPAVDTANFHPSTPESILTGMKVLHQKFGEGKVLAIDGHRDKRMATIFFPQLETEKEKRIMLKFAKLQVLE